MVYTLQVFPVIILYTYAKASVHEVVPGRLELPTSTLSV